ncbi:hypothetical protein [Thalassobellus suaedae]|uniref:Uncharacterized protein n=1 Tax=Thalassobellus suaedae TaxID=3074124 RepID=A0ABY9XW46_9FLAO|nr:hypothetical protein RHP51_05120 [Flavobacteriaceae bacterium HL-DH14]
MEQPEINALATRFKATSLMLINLNMLEIEEIDKGITITHELFDDGKFEHAKKMLDLVDSIIVDILEN